MSTRRLLDLPEAVRRAGENKGLWAIVRDMPASSRRGYHSSSRRYAMAYLGSGEHSLGWVSEDSLWDKSEGLATFTSPEAAARWIEAAGVFDSEAVRVDTVPPVLRSTATLIEAVTRGGRGSRYALRWTLGDGDGDTGVVACRRGPDGSTSSDDAPHWASLNMGEKSARYWYIPTFDSPTKALVWFEASRRPRYEDDRIEPVLIDDLGVRVHPSLLAKLIDTQYAIDFGTGRRRPES